MPKKARKRSAPAQQSSSLPETPRSPAPARSRRTRLLFGFLAAILVPAMLVAAVELGLRIAGFGYPTSFFLPLPDGMKSTVNRKFGWQFYPRETATQPHPVLMQTTKPSGKKRIFVLGESAAAGTPDPAFGFARILEVMLQAQYPEADVEVVNAAMRGINSHIVLPIARDCAKHDPDLFIVYMGNNELIGLHSPDPEGLHLTPYLSLLRFIQWAKATKIGQAIETALYQIRTARTSDPADRPRQDMEFFRKHRLPADHPRREAVYDNFNANLRAICDTIRDSGADTVLATVAVNLADFPPLASVHRADLTAAEKEKWDAAYTEGIANETRGMHAEAIQHYRAAAAVDDHYAELHFRLGRSLLAVSEFAKAKEHFVLARDWDALQFRTDNRINGIIRQTAAHRTDVRLVDAERAFSESDLSRHGIPGRRLFYEHVHFTFDGDYLLARTVLPAAVETLGLGTSPHPIPTRDQCADALAFTIWDEINVASAMADLTSKPPFLDQLEHEERQVQLEREIQRRLNALRQADIDRVLATYRQALARRPNDWQIRYNLANLYSELKQYEAAAAEFKVVADMLPIIQPFRLAHAQALAKAGHWHEALAQFEVALKIDPKNQYAQQALEFARAKASQPARQ